MPITQGTRTLAATRQELWDVLGDPHHLPRWWPRVTRVEAVEEDAFTEVLVSSKGKVVRADFMLVDSLEPSRIVWAQRIENTPFERILRSAETEISLADAGDSQHTTVTIELRQELPGLLAGRAGARAAATPETARRAKRRLPFSIAPSFGGFLMRRAADTTIEEALDGLERIVGGSV